MNDLERTAAEGDGAEHFDAATTFYLSFSERIEEWAKLRDKARASTATWYRSVIEPQVRRGWEPATFEEGSMHWRPEGCSDDLTIGLMWDSNPMQPYVGVHARTEAAGEAFRKAVDRPLHRYKSAKWFPAWRWVTLSDIDPRWWAHLDAVRDRLIDELTAALDELGPLVLRASNDLSSA